MTVTMLLVVDMWKSSWRLDDQVDRRTKSTVRAQRRSVGWVRQRRQRHIQGLDQPVSFIIIVYQQP